MTEQSAALDLRDWPRTTRVLPWLAAALLVMLYLVPFDSLTLPVPLPFDAKADRVALMGCFGVWALVAATRRSRNSGSPAHRYGVVELLLVALPLFAIMTIALNFGTLQALDEGNRAIKQLAVLAAYVSFYIFVVSAIRPTEVPAFARLVVGLAVICALGTILQYAADTNLFYRAAGALSPPGTALATNATILTPSGRPDITGPARHGLAVSTMLAMTLPIALVGATLSNVKRDRALFWLAAMIIFAGAAITIRRTGIILPFVASSAVIFGGGRRMLVPALVFVALLAVGPVAFPGVTREIGDQFSTSNVAATQSVQDRTSDYAAIGPDVRSHALVGRGFGSYVPSRYRFLDNQYLGVLIEMGGIGLALYLLFIVAAGGSALLGSRRASGAASWFGLAAFGSALTFLVANAFFDALGFPQAPYTFLLVIALAAISRRPAEVDDTAASQPSF